MYSYVETISPVGIFSLFLTSYCFCLFRDGLPYCEKDYQAQFGVKCAYCNRYISGKVLQAGDNHHFHPTCARCTKCGDPFGDGEEMYLQGKFRMWRGEMKACSWIVALKGKASAT